MAEQFGLDVLDLVRRIGKLRPDEQAEVMALWRRLLAEAEAGKLEHITERGGVS